MEKLMVQFILRLPLPPLPYSFIETDDAPWNRGVKMKYDTTDANECNKSKTENHMVEGLKENI